MDLLKDFLKRLLCSADVMGMKKNKLQKAKKLAWSLTSDEAFTAYIDNHRNADRAFKRLTEALELPERPTARREYPPLKIAS